MDIDFNPLRPRGRRPRLRCVGSQCKHFNPLRPRGRRPRLRGVGSQSKHFNPLRPRGRRLVKIVQLKYIKYFNPLRPRGRRQRTGEKQGIHIQFQPTPPARTETVKLSAQDNKKPDFNPLRPRGRRQQYYTKKPTILHHISTIKSHHTPSNHRQPTLHTSKTVLIVQFFRCESPRKFMFASGSHQTI